MTTDLIHDSTRDAAATAARVSRAEYRRSSPPLLRSRALDRLTRTGLWLPIAFYLPVSLALILLGVRVVGTLRGAALVLGGYVLWTLTEYWLHRLVFHWAAKPGTAMAAVHWFVHGVHHEHPDDPERVMMPLAGSIPPAAAFCLLFRLAFGAASWLPVAGGFLGGYLLYDVVHYLLHHHRPRTTVGRELRRRHLLHHYQDGRTGFAVSAPWLDHVFRTAPAPRPRRG
ncbi:sterol desaturase family protein [Streptacidiphilus albus]|uniref:sterol desaturase family protein n=1 Tax=Streptacidiphilus albus TaxID=105425 RepID=UPI0006897B3A|nr:sterol desaturase family protein [Streptacidiphilus albus]